MFTYTKRELKLLVLSLVLFVLLMYNIVIFPFLNFDKQFFSGNVYSKTISMNQSIPIYSINNQEQVKSKLIEKQNKNNVTKTQNTVINENKNIKWRVQIPKINLNVHIMEGTSDNVLLKAVGHFEETSKWKGNVGLAAHNRGYNCNFFEKIKNLKMGDEIIYTTTNGKRVYKVQTNKVIKDTDWSYLKETNDNRITLITCEENREEYRRCIQAVEVFNYKV